MNTESEVISAVCVNKDIHYVFEADIDDLFQSHGDIWHWVQEFYKKYREVPTLSQIQSKFRDFEPSNTDGKTPFYVDKLRNEHLRGRLKTTILDLGKSLNSKPPAELIEQMQRAASRLAKETGNITDVDVKDWELAEKHFSDLRNASDEKGAVGIKTGLAAIDSSYVTGMAPGHYIILIGYPSKGKSWIAAYLAVKSWEAGFKPMIVSVEMSPEDMRDRVYGLMGSGLFRVSDLQQGAVDVDQFRQWGKTKLESNPSFIIVSSDGRREVTPHMIQAKIDQHQPDIVFCDYMQLMTDNQKSDKQTPRMMNLSRELKLLAVNNKVPLIAISAVTPDDNRSLEDPPMLDQAAWSRAFWYDADLAMAVHRHTDTDMVEVVSRKNRFGQDFGVFLDVDLNNGVIRERF